MFTDWISCMPNYGGIKEVRGRGLLWAIELNKGDQQLFDNSLNCGLLPFLDKNNLIPVAPPLNMTSTDFDVLLTCLGQVLKKEAPLK